jgi:uncharacterized LabA/DUF88 family protein/ABC-type methionine transport system permease subunit
VSKNVAVFVDVANLYYAARGQDVDVDYVALLKHATKGRDLIRAYAYSGLDPENENQKKFLDFLGKNGYRVVAKDIRKFGDGRVKANLDIELVVDLFRLADRMDVAVIVSGDGDFAPAIRALQDVGVRCEVISFKPNTSSDLFAVADEFHDAMKISAIGRQKETKGVGAPEMPAKEVNPDVGFREASPSVAAAALAAIRSDGDEPATRGRGRGTRRPTAAAGRGGRGRTRSADAEPVASANGGATTAPGSAAPQSGDDAESESGRRRRRRGGRGRGRRGRHGDLPETADATNGEPTEIRWDEVDSLVQRTIEVIRSFPELPLWMALRAALPITWDPIWVYFGITIILGLIDWTGLARAVRSKVLALREEDFALAALLMGARPRRIVLRHLVPSFMSHLIASATLSIPGMILGETALSFLGLGLRPPITSWGVLLNEAQNINVVALYPWLMAPVVPVIITVLAFNFLGDGLRDAFDPRMKQ